MLGLGARLLAWAALWLAFLHPPGPPAATGLDDSWAQAYAEVLTRPLRLGVDVVFTFGPLGYFTRAPFAPELFHAALLFDLLFKGALAALFVAAVWQIRGVALRLAALAFLVFFEFAASDGPMYLAGALGGALLARDDRRLIGAAAITALLAAISLIKFPYLVVAALCAGAAVVAQRRRPGFAAALALLFGAWHLLGWVLCGQRLGDLPAYLASFAEVAAGYSEAMAIAGPLPVLAFAGLVLAVWAALLAHAWRRRILPLPIACMFAAVAFLSFKAGFVTQDVHVWTTFGFLGGSVAFLAGRGERGPSPGAAAGAFAVMLLTAGGMLGATGELRPPGEHFARWGQRVQRNVHALLYPAGLASALVHSRAQLAQQHALPRIREQVGDAPVDILDWEQGVLLLNGLHWRPRPVIHGYMAYTQALQARNAGFLASAGAPEFLILRQQTRRDWLPGMADSAALQVILRDYAPLLEERGYLLLQRAPHPAVPLPWGRPPVLEAEVEFDQPVALAAYASAGAVFASIDLEHSAWGRLCTALYKPPRVDLEATLDDGTTLRQQVLPGILRSGVLVRPLLRTTADVREHALGRVVPGAAKIVLRVAPGGAAAFRQPMRLRLYVDPGPPASARAGLWRGGS